ncbi:helix-turn-helix domain-containing protein [Roseococcus pinisoli]|uniref:Helix-turn-helix transcriptional regulator n=1 Tax=Roseococcus pinisoli TaxID=2835040 RepID=A0ABS5Q934_9PROT|nr:helix-turn-helix transcriptional regulator [Roseococcus pinisoli]MBS7810225.1 helix-turn-helix transcriptional regulator [Roseococcus pinisoli]
MRPVGDLLRDWRQRRRLSQLGLALDAGISARHLSFLETGRAQPSREMVVLLAEQLEVPLRERNALLLAAGYAPLYRERGLDDPDFAAIRAAVQRILAGHEPFPAVAVDRHWNLVAMNGGVGPLLAGVDAALLAPPVNVLRLSLHPAGLAPRIANLAQWREHLLSRLGRQIADSGDPVLASLRQELEALPHEGGEAVGDELTALAVPLQLRTERGLLSFISTSMVFGAPRDIGLAELAIEAFLPADDATAAALRP